MTMSASSVAAGAPAPSTALAVPAALPAGERLPVLDVLRAFALLGILIMNMPGFGTSFFAQADGSYLWTAPVDRVAEEVRDMLFAGKFNSMFSLLFGIGFTIQHARLRERDPQHADAIYGRRLAVLLVLGTVHAVVFWPGDVLHIYAVLGLVVLLALRRSSDRALVALVALCALYPVVSGLLRLKLMTPEDVAGLVARAQAFEASNNVAYGTGGFVDVMRENARVMAHFYGDPWSMWSTLSFYVQMLLTMTIGLLAGRHRWAERIPELMPRICRLTWQTAAFGMACAAAYTLIFATHRQPGPSPIKMLGSLCYHLARPALMICYVLIIVRMVAHPAWARRLRPMQAAGRMPLTNYLMQTLVCITLFHGWGFGLWGRVGPAAMLVSALAIFVMLQLPWSMWWLSRHERGPMEALWARLTYGTSHAAHDMPTAPRR
jgi:uncharacterized protein